MKIVQKGMMEERSLNYVFKRLSLSSYIFNFDLVIMKIFQYTQRHAHLLKAWISHVYTQEI